jgi:hypothetical protein
MVSYTKRAVWALAQPQKAASRIDPNQIPSPVTVMEKDQREYAGQQMYYGTCSKPAPPLATTDFIALDEGMASALQMSLSVSCRMLEKRGLDARFWLTCCS